MNNPLKRIVRREKIFQFRTASCPLSRCLLITSGELSFSLIGTVDVLIVEEFADAILPAGNRETCGLPEIDPETK